MKEKPITVTYADGEVETYASRAKLSEVIKNTLETSGTMLVRGNKYEAIRALNDIKPMLEALEKSIREQEFEITITP